MMSKSGADHHHSRDATIELRPLSSQLCREKVKEPTLAQISPPLNSYMQPKRNCGRPQLVGRYVQTVSVTLVIIQMWIAQDHNNPKPG